MHSTVLGSGSSGVSFRRKQSLASEDRAELAHEPWNVTCHARIVGALAAAWLPCSGGLKQKSQDHAAQASKIPMEDVNRFRFLGCVCTAAYLNLFSAFIQGKAPRSLCRSSWRLSTCLAQMKTGQPRQQLLWHSGIQSADVTVLLL